MNIPDILPINRMEEYHTHYIGRCSDGNQFLGRERVWVYFDPKKNSSDLDYLKSRGEYVVLHIFDKDGNYLSTRHWYAGTSSDFNNEVSLAMTEKLEKWINELGEYKFSDIAVKLFQVNIDGFTFGLLPNEEYNSICLQPSCDISFIEPWDGEYYT